MTLKFIDLKLMCSMILIVAAYFSQIVVGEPILTGEALVYKTLMDKYGPKIRPPPYNKPTQVAMEYFPVKLLYLKQEEQEMAMAAVILVFWIDQPRLSWNPLAFNGTVSINIPLTEIWYPPIAHLRSTDGNYNIAHDGNEDASVAANGMVTWLSGDTYLSSCVFDVTYFPFDVQICRQRFTAWPDQSKMNLSNKLLGITSETRLSYYEINAEWNLTCANVTMNPIGGQQELVVEITLHRKPTYYVLTILVPSALLAGLILMVFALPVDCGEKLSFGITVMLTFSVFQLMVADSLPQTSDSYPIVGIGILFLEFMSTLSISVSVFVLNIHHFGPIEGKMRYRVRYLIFGLLATITCSRSLVLKHRIPENSVQPIDSPGIKLQQIGKGDSPSQKSLGRLVLGKKNYSSITKILREVKQLTAFANTQKHENVIIEEWKLAAMIVDRLLMLVSLLIIVVVLTALLAKLLTNS